MTYTVTVTRAKSDDATLGMLTLSELGTADAGLHDADDTSYTAQRGEHRWTSTTVTATLPDDSAAKDPVISPDDAQGRRRARPTTR